LLAGLTCLASGARGSPPSRAASNVDASAHERQVDEQLKAAMFYRIAKFIDWPARAFASPDAPFVVCIAGDMTVLRAFQTLNGRILYGHGIVVHRISGDMLNLRQCHAAFFSRHTLIDTDYALSKLQGEPVLTVGEAEDFAERGGILAFATRQQRLQFAINVTSSKQAGLVVSAQLLKLATVVGGTP
jgi:hypothetical protein